VRSAFGGAVFGVAGITVALVFAASLSHLVETPRLFGWTWDVKAEVPTASPCVDAKGYGLEQVPGIDAVGVVCTTFNDFELDGRPITGWGFRSLHGTIEPEIVDGRAPSGPREMALGSATMSAIGKHIGDTVTARGPNGKVKYQVVGQVVLPTVGEAQPMADGAAVTVAGYRPLYDPGENETDYLVARAKPGRAATIERDVRRIRFARNIATPEIPVELERLQQIDRIPGAIAALLAGLALIAVGHALVTAVRRRRSDLAVLKVLGFDRRQVRATVAWHATILGGAGLVLGLPIGIILGRLLWQFVARGLGVSTDVTIPTLWILVSIPCVLAAVNLIAFVPGRSAARTRPAAALRSA
jgi:FtsX-like permease family